MCLQPQVGVLVSSLVTGVSLSDQCFLSLQQLLWLFCLLAHIRAGLEQTQRTTDPLHFLVAQLQSPIPQEVLGRGPAVSRDTELFAHMNGLKPCGALCSFISSQCVGVFLISSWWDLCHFLLFMFWFYFSHRPAVWVVLIPTRNPEDIWVNDYYTDYVSQINPHHNYVTFSRNNCLCKCSFTSREQREAIAFLESCCLVSTCFFVSTFDLAFAISKPKRGVWGFSPWKKLKKRVLETFCCAFWIDF